jgi:hypothetical protein
VDASQWRPTTNRRGVQPPGWRSAPRPMWTSLALRRPKPSFEETDTHDRWARPAASMMVQAVVIERVGKPRRRAGGGGGVWVAASSCGRRRVGGEWQW